MTAPHFASPSALPAAAPASEPPLDSVASDELPSTIPKSSERAHPLALELWGILRDRGVADKMLVLRACDRRLGLALLEEKQERAVFAVSCFIADRGHVPHATEWDDWRRDDATRECLPSATFIRNAFGGWSGLREVFDGGPELDVLSSRLTARGATFPKEELLSILDGWARATQGVLRQGGLEGWLLSDGPAEIGLGRVPRGVQVFRRLGPFREVLRGLGFGDRLTQRSRSGVARAVDAAEHGVRSSGIADELVGLVRRWAKTHDGVLYLGDFVAYWSSISNDEVSEPGGQEPCLDALAHVCPSQGAVRAALGSWREALAAAGLAHRGRRSVAEDFASTRPNVPGGLRPVLGADFESMAVWVRLAAQKFGVQMSYPQYTRWRRERIEKAVAAGRSPEPIPSVTPLRRAVGGSWFDVKVEAGVPGAAEFAASRCARGRHPEGRLLDTVAEFLLSRREVEGQQQTGQWQAPRPCEYMRWRDQRVAERRQVGLEPDLASVETLRKRLGGPEALWDVVVSTVLQERAEVLSSSGLNAAKPLEAS